MSMKITTNKHFRQMVTWFDIPENKRDDFDYISEDEKYSNRFVEYKGEWYDVYDSVGTHRTTPFPKYWDAYISDSFFSGILFHFADEKDADNGKVDYMEIENSVVVGWYCS